MHFARRRLWGVIAGACLIFAAAPRCGQAAAAETNKTVITAKTLDFDYQKRTAVFQGDVVVVDPAVRITADTMTVVFDENNAPETITAIGRVRIEQPDRIATCSRAAYSVRSGLMVLTGKPMVRRGSDVLTGTRIIFSRDDNRVSCEGATLRILPSGGGLTDVFGQ